MGKWKAEAFENLASVFVDEKRSVESLKAQHEKEKQELFKEIGQLTTQLSWLKKSASTSPLRLDGGWSNETTRSFRSRRRPGCLA